MRRLSGGLPALLVAVTGLTEPIRLRTEGDLPFSPSQLSDAVAARHPVAEDAGLEVLVRATGTGRILVQAQGKTRTVELGDRTGPQAARRVALAVLDLVTPEAEAPALVSPPPPPAPRAPAFELGVLPTIGAGTNFEEMTLGAALDADLRIAGTLRACAGVGFATDPAAPTVADVSLSFRAVLLRAGLAWQSAAAPLELRLQAVAMPYFVDATSPGMSASRSGLVAGAGAAVRYAWTLSPAFDLAFLGGVDGFAVRDDLRVHGAPALATDRVGFWAGVGIWWKP